MWHDEVNYMKLSRIHKIFKKIYIIIFQSISSCRISLYALASKFFLWFPLLLNIFHSFRERSTIVFEIYSYNCDINCAIFLKKKTLTHPRFVKNNYVDFYIFKKRHCILIIISFDSINWKKLNLVFYNK